MTAIMLSQHAHDRAVERGVPVETVKDIVLAPTVKGRVGIELYAAKSVLVGVRRAWWTAIYKEIGGTALVVTVYEGLPKC